MTILRCCRVVRASQRTMQTASAKPVCTYACMCTGTGGTEGVQVTNLCCGTLPCRRCLCNACAVYTVVIFIHWVMRCFLLLTMSNESTSNTIHRHTWVQRKVYLWRLRRRRAEVVRVAIGKLGCRVIFRVETGYTGDWIGFQVC